MAALIASFCKFSRLRILARLFSRDTTKGLYSCKSTLNTLLPENGLETSKVSKDNKRDQLGSSSGANTAQIKSCNKGKKWVLKRRKLFIIAKANKLRALYWRDKFDNFAEGTSFTSCLCLLPGNLCLAATLNR